MHVMWVRRGCLGQGGWWCADTRRRLHAHHGVRAGWVAAGRLEATWEWDWEWGGGGVSTRLTATATGAGIAGWRLWGVRVAVCRLGRRLNRNVGPVLLSGAMWTASCLCLAADAASGVGSVAWLTGVWARQLTMGRGGRAWWWCTGTGQGGRRGVGCAGRAPADAYAYTSGGVAHSSTPSFLVGQAVPVTVTDPDGVRPESQGAMRTNTAASTGLYRSLFACDVLPAVPTATANAGTGGQWAVDRRPCCHTCAWRLPLTPLPVHRRSRPLLPLPAAAATSQAVCCSTWTRRQASTQGNCRCVWVETERASVSCGRVSEGGY